jgi:osmotically-inducible protein OsmY
MKKNKPPKKRGRSPGTHWRNGIVLLGFAAVAVTWSLQAENPGQAVTSFSLEDERNQLAESVGPEIYNAPAYAAMEREILDAIRTDVSLSEESMQIDVSVEEGVVILRGNVRNQIEGDRIVKLAREPAGMARIDSQLEIGGLR